VTAPAPAAREGAVRESDTADLRVALEVNRALQAFYQRFAYAAQQRKEHR
jgi:hypothetical protein